MPGYVTMDFGLPVSELKPSIPALGVSCRLKTVNKLQYYALQITSYFAYIDGVYTPIACDNVEMKITV